MQIKCDYCNSMIDEGLESCPHCGAPLSGVNRTASSQPQTIEELQAWYTAHNLPPEYITRFFIGKNITEPKAFGIYKTETGDFVVYKNKANGERAVRYQGSDEKYAVNELYQRLRAEIVDQKANNNVKKQSNNYSNSKTTSSTPVKKRNWGCIIPIIVLVFGALGWFTKYAYDMPEKGYYNYQGNEYYHQGDKWYSYDKETDAWSLTNESMSSILSKEITHENQDQYRISSDDHQGQSFEETPWYDNGYHSNEGSSYSSYDDDDGWDSDSSWDDDDDWDSGSSDWDSDW